MTMITIEAVAEHPACIVFGQPVRGSQQAAWFTEPEVEMARKAKNAKTLAFLAPIPPDLEEVAKALSRGRVQAGQVSLTKVAPDAYAKLLAAAAAQRNGQVTQVASASVEKTKPVDAATVSVETKAGAIANLPAVMIAADSWSQLKVGDLVLAHYGPEDGWWGARILKIENDVFTLAWVDETEPMARRTRAQLALFHPRLT